MQPVPPSLLRYEYLTNPLGLNSSSPRFSWLLEHPGRATHQAAYQVIVSPEPSFLDKEIGDYWDIGPILMFGLGGIYVEALEGVSFRLAPIREYSALTMIQKTKAHKILDGFRGGPVYDIEAIADCLKRLSQLVVDFEAIKELDIKPLLVYEKGRGCRIVDARIILEADPR